MLFFLLIFQIIAFKQYSGQVCTWPEDFVDSTWIDSLKGDMVFSSTTMSGWSFDVEIQASATVQTLDSWECVSQGSPYLIMKTTETFTLFITQDFTGYRCIIPEKITDYSYRYYQAEPIQISLDNERIFISTDDSLTDPSILCQFPSTGAEFQVMIKKGYESSAKVVCPYSLLADYTFTYSQSDGTVTCDAVSDQGALYMCTNITEISVQAPACSPYTLYSNGNSSWCVDVVTVGSDTFVSLYNDQQDSSIPNTYQFVCVGINSEGTSMSLTPQHCKANQSSTEIPADNSGNNVGAVWSLSISADPCPPCPTLSEPFQGSVNVSTNGAVTIATYGCDDTYTLSGNDTRICQANGDWSDNAPSCTCPIPSSVSNGNVNVTNNGLTVTFTCNTGYVLVGTSTLTCNIVTNNWSDAYPTCEECETLSAPSDGSVTITSDGHTSFATYSCDTGTTLNGGSSRTCNTDTTWTNAAPTCTSCPTLTDIASGNVTLSTDDTTTTATYYCATGYTLNGDNTSICTTSGTWDSTPPSCECDDPLSPDNGTVTVSNGKTQAGYTCNVGFTLHGVSTRTCQMDGTGWSSNDPVCVGCPSLSSPNNGSVSLSTNGILTEATYTCEVGFTLNGDVTSQCQIDGSWSATAPTCSLCDAVPTVTSGSYTLISDGSTTSAQYTCSVGTTISGDVTIACDVNGVWSISSENTTCVECPDLSTSGGSYQISSNGTISTAELVCDTGYVLESGDTIECQSNGSWSLASTESQCVLTTTPVPSESKSGDSSLLPAVIAVSIIAVGLGIAFLLSVCYIWKLKKNAQGNSKKTNENGTASYLFPASKAPLDHSQHVMDFRNTSSAMSAAPWSHHPSPRVDSITPRSLSTTTSSNSLHLSHLNLIREDTASTVILDQNNPAPWSRTPKHEHGTSLSTGPFPPINESGTGLTTPRGNDDTGQKHARKKKRSFTKKMQSQNSVHASETEASDNEQKKSRVVKSDSMKQRSERRMMVNRNASTSNIKGTASNGGIVVPKLKLSEPPTRASTPVKHQIEVKDPDQCRTPRSNTFSTVQ